MEKYNPGRMVILGVVFWLLGALTIRFGYIPFFDAPDGGLVIAYLAGFPTAWLTIVILEKFGQLGRSELCGGLAIATAAAICLDGIVLPWFPILYSATSAAVPLGSAWLLWVGGLTLGYAAYRSTQPA